MQCSNDDRENFITTFIELLNETDYGMALGDHNERDCNANENNHFRKS